MLCNPHKMKLRFLHPLPIHIVLSFSNMNPGKNNVFWSGILEVEGGVGAGSACCSAANWFARVTSARAPPQQPQASLHAKCKGLQYCQMKNHSGNS